MNFALKLYVLAQALPATDSEAVDLAKGLWRFMVEKNYGAALGPLLTLMVWALRKWDLNIPKVGPAIDAFLNKPFVAFLTPVVLSALGGFGTALAAGKPASQALLAIVAAATSAITTYVGLQKATEAVQAGKVAAAAVSTKAQAVEELKKP